MHVRQVLRCLIAHNKYARVEKWKFHKTSFASLGYEISAEGLAVDQGEVEAVQHWPQPTSVKEPQRFLSIANFYRSFSSMAAPLTSLLKGAPKRLLWTLAATEEFWAFKQRFTQAPVLHRLDRLLRS